MRVHILGICGTLMGSLALLAKEQGHDVSGSDQNVYPPMSDMLKNAGIEIMEGFKAEHLKPEPDLVIIGNADLPRGNEAVEYVLDQKMAYTSGAEWLGKYLVKDRWVIAVAGTHGKTTTTSMIAWILEYAGLNPGFLIGGVPANFSQSARMGSEPFFVVEADEYDTSYFDRRSKFLHYHPRTLVLNNLEFDHADIFPDLAAIQNQFHLLLRTIPGSGLIVRNGSDSNLQTVINKACWTPQELFSISGESDNNTGWYGKNLDKGCTAFEVYLDGKKIGTVNWQLSGEHNMQNALAAIAAARHAGVKPETAMAALAEFRSVKRRLEVIYDSGALKVYDDFAHHPTAIATTLDGLRGKVGNEGIMVLIEPRSYTMRSGVHQEKLKAACGQADKVIWYQPPNLSWDLARSLGNGNCEVKSTIEEVMNSCLRELKQGNYQHLVIMSNGGFGGIHKQIVSAISQDA